MFVDLQTAIEHVVIANRILAHEGVVDAYGHVSVRHPLRADWFLLSCSRSPELVVADDIKVYDFEGRAVEDDGHQPYLERFIHSAVYRARPEVNAVIHSHANAVLPFTIVKQPLVPVIASASEIGSPIPRWDIRDEFGDTNLLVANPEHGRSMAEALGPARTVLMRGHGFTTTAGTLVQAVKAAIYIAINAATQMEAMRMGEFTPLSQGEIELRNQLDRSQTVALERAWQYWRRRAGV